MMRAYIGLGSNIGDRRAALDEAVRRLVESAGQLAALSSVYRTDPVEVIDQEEFMNQVVALDTPLEAPALLERCLAIERQMGRLRTRHKGPRRIDLDLLLCGDTVLETEGIVVPHPRLHLRRFVLAPLAEIAPGARHPVLGLTAAELLERCPDPSRVERDRE
jgi:2-amino-4-hydroxy-6-hydroxymethyldihydropteridine diphosphokinase